VKHLDLFSGIGGFALGLQKVGFETVAFCEIDKYCQTLLNEKWKGVKIYNDVKEITKERLEADEVELPEIITGGFPCQPFSVAGKQKGTSDDRHLWPEMFRIIKELKPRWVIGENVKGLINLENGMVFETVCTNLEGEGYEVRAFNIPAAGVGAPHRRERIWIVAHRKESMVNADGVRLEQHNETKKETSWWRTSTTFKPTSNVVNTISNDKGREISRSDEEEGRIQEEHRQENSTSRVISGTSSVWQTDHGYEKNVANTESSHRNDNEINSRNGESEAQEILGDGSSIRGESAWWDIEPNVGRVAHGLPGRVHRLKGLGNAIVPQIAEEIGRAIMKAEQQ
jgi:DNA (cytosine-5)-methyltransferase 1